MQGSGTQSGGWSVQDILSRSRAAHAARAQVQPYIDRALEYAMPWRKPQQKGREAFDRLFDSSGPTGVHRFASRLQADFSPSFSRWFELECGPLVPLDEAEEVNRQLEAVTKICHAALDASAFPKASHECYTDLAVGTGALLGVPGTDGELIRWTAVPPTDLGIEEGPSGRVDNVYWERDYPADQLERLWPGARGWPEGVQRLINANATDKVRVLQASYYDARVRRWRFEVLCLQGSDGPGDSRGAAVRVYSSLNRTNPWIIPRWWTTPGNPWGLGPLMLVLPDIMTANKAVEMMLRAAAYQLAPPLMVSHDGVVNPDALRIHPHALIKVTRTGGQLGAPIEPLDMGGNVNLTDLALRDMKANIAQNLMARQLPPESAAVRSPTEIVERLREFAFDTGSAFGRLNHEFAPAVVARVLDLLDAAKVPLIDFDMLNIDHLVMKVKVTSPLARGQRLEDVESAARFVELIQAIGGGELKMALCNLEEMHRLGPLMGAPAWTVRPADQRRQIMQAMGEAAAEAQAPAEAPMEAPMEAMP
ncbi:MAG: portal protein [Brevundimonas sp.]|uniref:portal protein n=1 Tax=Brevundimonas sp. TaxID=1871086 RepID=UPI00391C21B5